jgi:hypothetical protein
MFAIAAQSLLQEAGQGQLSPSSHISPVFAAGKPMMHRLHSHTALNLERAAPYAIGGIAAFWNINRLSSFIWKLL